jgi:zinc transport system substrate-binding protein
MLYYNIIAPVNLRIKTSTMVQLKSICIKTHVFAMVAVITLTVGAMETRAKEIYVAASIRPLHSLVQMVLGEQGQAVLLLDGRVSPHNIVLRPSDRKHLSKADLVFIIDPGFEPLFAKALSVKDRNERLVVMTKAEGIRLKDRRLYRAFGHEDHVHDDEKHDDEHEDEKHDDEHDDEKHDDHDDHGHSHDDHGHDHLYGKLDLHLWLDPANAAAMIDLIQTRLAAVYPGIADAFQQNAIAAKQDLITLDADIHALLSPYQDRQVIVYHDAYSYFEDAYGIEARASILDHHDAQADIRRVRMLRQLVAGDEIACLFHEPQFDAKLLNLIDPQSRLRHVSLDPIGHDFVAGADQYRLMMMGIARSMVSCFQ